MTVHTLLLACLLHGPMRQALHNDVYIAQQLLRKLLKDMHVSQGNVYIVTCPPPPPGTALCTHHPPTSRPPAGGGANEKEDPGVHTILLHPLHPDQLFVSNQSSTCYLMNMNGQVIKALQSGKRQGGGAALAT